MYQLSLFLHFPVNVPRILLEWYLFYFLSYAVVNGLKTTLDTFPQIVNGRTLVPLRFVAESMNAKVDWNDNTRTITITSIPRMANPQKSIDEDGAEIYGDIDSNGEPVGYLHKKFPDGTFTEGYLGVDFDFGYPFQMRVNTPEAIGIGKIDDNGVNGIALTIAEDGIFYGNFVDSELQGEGLSILPSGKIYSGNNVNSLPDGYGILYQDGYGEIYGGQWESGLPKFVK